jgi:hypothetical protein
MHFLIKKQFHFMVKNLISFVIPCYCSETKRWRVVPELDLFPDYDSEPVFPWN